MLALLRGAVGPILRQLGPMVVSWGLNKLFSSGPFQTHVPKEILPVLKNGA